MSTNGTPRWAIAGVLATLLSLAGIAASMASPASQVFMGHYDWSGGDRDELIVKFTPDGDDQWKVRFEFAFDGDDNTWKGTASGSLDNRTEVTGTAKWKSRSWTWSATLEDGVLRGTHTELRSRGKTRRTGTFEIRR